MSKPLRGIRRLIANITEAFIRASREGAQCYARIDIDGELDWASDGEISVKARPQHELVRKAVDLEAGYSHEHIAEQGADFKLSLVIRTEP